MERPITHPMSGLLDRIMTTVAFNDFVLVGGTALALQLGHRQSVDIDLFTTRNYDSSIIKKEIRSLYPSSSIIYEQPNGLGFSIHTIKVEFVEWKEGFELAFDNYGKWRLLKKEIIAVMKLNAITGRTEKKDYADLAFLLKERSLKDLLQGYKECYPYQQVRPVLEKFVGNNELSHQPDPYFLSKVTWSEIELSLKNNLKSYYDWLKQERSKKGREMLDKAAKYKSTRG